MRATTAILLLGLLFPTYSQAQSERPTALHPQFALKETAPQNHLNLNWGSGEIDYLVPKDRFPPTQTKSAQQSLDRSTLQTPVESTVVYTSFTFGTTQTLRSFSGKYVSYLVPEEKLGTNGFSREDLHRAVDLTDVLYAHMSEIVGDEPPDEGPLQIALLDPGRDFGGRGWVGRKGVELYYSYMNFYKKDFLAGCVPNPIVHEMAHNFDIYRDYISHDGNNVHAWTAFLIPYVQAYSQSGAAPRGRVVSPSVLLDQTISDYLDTWDAAGTSVSWSDCVKNGTGCEAREIYANCVWAGIMLRFSGLHSGATLRRVFQFLKQLKNNHWTPPTSAEARNDLLVKALAEAARQNILCELQMWNWPVSASLAEELQIAFPGSNAFCHDSDADGFAPAQGDLDDFNSAIRPTGYETLNGIDDDSNGIVDDVIFEEQPDASVGSNAKVVPVPSHIIGRTATIEDRDFFWIEVASPTHINIRLTGKNRRFSGSLELEYSEGGSKIEVSSNSSAGTAVYLDRAGTWIITVIPWNGENELYEIFVSHSVKHLIPIVRFLPSSKSSFLMLQVTIDSDHVSQFAANQVRLWIQGVGFLGPTGFETNRTIKLKPNGLPPSPVIRAQLLNDGVPATNVSAAISHGTLRTTRTESDNPILIERQAPPGPSSMATQLDSSILIIPHSGLLLAPLTTPSVPYDADIPRSRCIPGKRRASKKLRRGPVFRARYSCSARIQNE
ncbi:MAG TPA: hypothetical protein VJ023_20415 [Pyrinomonadaceae bacterium]|nr:hypothetical protein [Pyrinomonadaceae bacterium]